MKFVISIISVISLLFYTITIITLFEHVPRIPNITPSYHFWLSLPVVGILSFIPLLVRCVSENINVEWWRVLIPFILMIKIYLGLFIYYEDLKKEITESQELVYINLNMYDVTYFGRSGSTTTYKVRTFEKHFFLVEVPLRYEGIAYEWDAKWERIWKYNEIVYRLKYN